MSGLLVGGRKHVGRSKVVTEPTMLPGVPSVTDLEWVSYLLERNFEPWAHITLTFDGRREGMSVEGALWMWRRLVRVLNELEGGRNYRDKWGHSYFGYVVGVEHHKSGVVHLHALVDNWIDFRRVHEWWNTINGFAWIRSLRSRSQQVAAIGYIVKYVVKEDREPTIWIQSRRRDLKRVVLSDKMPARHSQRAIGHGTGVKDGVHSAARRATQSAASSSTPSLTNQDREGQGRLL